MAWALVGVAPGCGDDCSAGAGRCQGDVLGSCSYDGEGPFSKATWHDAKCAVACHEMAGQAFCVDSPEPAPECAGATDDVCFAGQPATCWGGFPIDDPSCDPGTHCAVSASCGATCAIDDTPDPRCSPQPFCENGKLTTCSCDLVVRRIDCGAPDLCREMSGDAVCTKSSTPDPRCGDPAQHKSGFCDGGTAFSCWFGFVAGALNCGASPCVARVGQAAACEISVSTR